MGLNRVGLTGLVENILNKNVQIFLYISNGQKVDIDSFCILYIHQILHMSKLKHYVTTVY